MAYLLPFVLGPTLLPFLYFGNTIDALRLLRLFSILPFLEDFGLEVLFEAS